MSHPEDKYLFLDLPPTSAVIEYFDVLVKDKPLYLTVFVDEDQSPTLFLEPNPLKGHPATCRVFFRKDDVRQYIQTVSIDRRIPEHYLRAWESSFSHLSKFMPKFDSTLKDQGKGGVFAVGCTLHRQCFTNVDVFWTSHQGFMV